ncbi:uncharacterized protein LOC124372853 isoform X2 [Homalodisca vitripennis]|uniref:uncharacterized protein LOC124372853 isoform X2 n=1 Tax=Homalodisca vitripennis TaxID=197043 RepID=UPI001EEAC10B|nr:uncharacterized protein LOC124372853 isoform X2 [Homalodisca vitripennis]XP_046687222.1 uncharacterized protein LOC124372853 isoform X2 [Homalodisca vitripennis]XP_046687223.1 uncharacterized protein LOC124372853 isoform X2 [Homalodisca vitripennis]
MDEGKDPSKQENYDDLSSIQRTEDSFELDKKMSTWKTDDESLQKCLRRLSGDQHDMKVIHMKLTMVKQYVQSIHENMLWPTRQSGLLQQSFTAYSLLYH